MILKAPFPYFGGKSRIADVIWEHLGDVDNYVEPFAGSLAVLLMRPGYHNIRAETVNDKDFYLANFWRSIRNDPDKTAFWADYPVSEADLTARHIWLVTEGKERIANLEADPDLFDPKVAGWWVWGLSIWIGSGWCSGDGPWRISEEGKLEKADAGVRRKIPLVSRAGTGVHRKMPAVADGGKGISRQLPFLAASGKGVARQLPALTRTGQGVNREIDAGVVRRKPSLMNAGKGTQRGAVRGDPDALSNYFQTLSDRLRNVRIACGDWKRICTPGALDYGEKVGIFLDPPYSTEERMGNIYTHDEDGLAAEVRQWARENGSNPRYRIALCGYEGEDAMPSDWMEVPWTATASYKSSRGDLTQNRHRERVWFSPGCLDMPLFEVKYG